MDVGAVPSTPDDPRHKGDARYDAPIAETIGAVPRGDNLLPCFSSVNKPAADDDDVLFEG